MSIITLNNLSINRSDTASSGQVWTATSATAADFQAASGVLKSININADNTLSQASSTSDSMVDVSGVDVVLTPASTSSKFAILTSFNFDVGGTDRSILHRLTYNHSGISQSAVDASYGSYGDDAINIRLAAWTAQMYYLAPSTTNEITFRLQYASDLNGSAVYVNRKTIRITAWEYV